MRAEVVPRWWVLSNLVYFCPLFLLVKYSTMSMYLYSNTEVNVCEANISTRSPTLLLTPVIAWAPMRNGPSSYFAKRNTGFDV